MDHAQFKAKQTAAVYVADGLDERTLEAFEMHMMGCTECVEDVESWRAIKVNMPLEQNKMEWLLTELAKTDCPMSCPHGRPVVLRYSVKEIQKAFKRI